MTWHDICSQQVPCQPPWGGGGVNPPHFFEIFLIDRVRVEVGGGFPQSLIQFILILYNPQYKQPSLYIHLLNILFTI